MVADWYRALDLHVAVEIVVRDWWRTGWRCVSRRTTTRGRDGFADWYKAVTNRFFDEVHTVSSVDITSNDGDQANVKVVVNWQAKIWNPPDAKSQWLGFDALPDVGRRAAPTARPVIRTYVVDGMDLMPGSSTL